MKNNKIVMIEQKIVQLEREYGVYKREIVKEQSMINRHRACKYPDNDAIKERLILIRELERAMDDLAKLINLSRRELEDTYQSLGYYNDRNYMQ